MHNLRNLRIADLDLFITAAHLKTCEIRNFHHLSQSAASAAIQRVEGAFGLALCTRKSASFA